MNHNICLNTMAENFFKSLFLFQVQDFFKSFQSCSQPKPQLETCKLPLKHSGTRDLPWESEEDSIIFTQVQQFGEKYWSKIANKINYQVHNGKMLRKGKHCRERWFNHIDPSLNSKEYVEGEWAAEEDEQLVRLQRKYGNAWSFIAKNLPGRNENLVRNRWKSLKKKGRILSDL